MYKLRIYIIFFVIAMFGFAVGGKLFFVQVVEADRYISQAEDQYVQRNYHFYDRGNIYFKDKEGELVSAATVKGGHLISINSEVITDPHATALKLEKAIGLESDHFMERYRKEKKYTEVASRLSDEEAQKVRSLGLKGVSVYPEFWRFYPGNETASHTIGFTSFKEHDYGGRYGLEREYEDVLKRPDSDYKVDFFAQIFGNISKGFQDSNGKGGERGDIVTTIEPVVQSFLEQELKNIEEKWESRNVGGIIIDPSTGAIKAMAARPTFDLNSFSKVDSDSVFANPLVENVYEMGSVVKPLTMAAGLDSGAVERSDTYYDSGRVVMDGYVISNFDGRGNGEVSMQDVLNKSINTGVVYVMEEMGKDKFAEYMRAFGLESKTGIDLPNETENLIRSFDSPRSIEYATASFGQGIALTPIGITRALCAIANGGRVVDPYLAEAIKKDNGEMIDLREGEKKGKRVIKEESSREISRMLVNTVDEALLNGDVSLENHTVAAKTGTAQIPDQGGYRDDAFLHSFFGYFPAYDPEFLVFIYTIEPQGVMYASQTLTEPFMNITNFLIQYYGINPDR